MRESEWTSVVKARVGKIVKSVKEPATWTSGRRAMQAEEKKQGGYQGCSRKLQEWVVGGGGQRVGAPGEGLAVEGFMNHCNEFCFTLREMGSHWQVGAERRQHLTFTLKACPSSCCIKPRL